jgi:hypothetical protein
MPVSIPNTIVPNTLCDADDVQENFDALAAGAVSVTGDTLTGTLNVRHVIPSTASTYDIGTALKPVRVVYADSIVGASANNSFSTIAVSGQSNVVADSATDTLTLVAGAGMTLTTSAGGDSVTFAVNPATTLAGASAITIGVGGVIYQAITTAGNTTTGEDTLFSQAIAANVLSADGATLQFYASGGYANNANAKRVKVKWGSTTIVDTGASAVPQDSKFTIRATITRLSGTTQRVDAEIHAGNFLTGVDYLQNISSTTAAETLSNAITLAVTGEAVDTNDIQIYVGRVYYFPASPQ